jgi:broad specificity phosphatase PhoE
MTSVNITYFVHGTTKDNEVGNRSGWNDIDLSPLGIKQAEELITQTQNRYFDVVFCSDLKRAINSASLGFNRFTIIQDKRLREINYGDLTALHESKFIQKDEHYIQNPFPNGESFGDVEKRMAEFIQEMKMNYQSKQIAVVAHRAPQLALEVLIKGKTWKEALSEDWRISKKWQPGWEYVIKY